MEEFGGSFFLLVAARPITRSTKRKNSVVLPRDYIYTVSAEWQQLSLCVPLAGHEVSAHPRDSFPRTSPGRPDRTYPMPKVWASSCRRISAIGGRGWKAEYRSRFNAIANRGFEYVDSRLPIPNAL